MIYRRLQRVLDSVWLHVRESDFAGAFAVLSSPAVTLLLQLLEGRVRAVEKAWKEEVLLEVKEGVEEVVKGCEEEREEEREVEVYHRSKEVIAQVYELLGTEKHLLCQYDAAIDHYTTASNTTSTSNTTSNTTSTSSKRIDALLKLAQVHSDLGQTNQVTHTHTHTHSPT